MGGHGEEGEVVGYRVTGGVTGSVCMGRHTGRQVKMAQGRLGKGRKKASGKGTGPEGM